MKLTNKDISDNHRNNDYYFMLSDFQGAFAYYVTTQNNNGTFNVDEPLEAYTRFLQQKYFKVKGHVRKFTFDDLKTIVNEDIFITIPEIYALNQMKPDFIDLGALSRNVFYMILREYITQS